MKCPLCKTNLDVENKTNVILKDKKVLEIDGGGLVESLDQLEKFLLIKALEKYEGNRAAAARMLGIKYHQFRYIFEKHELEEQFPANWGRQPG